MQIVLNTIMINDKEVCRALLATYYKIGTYNVFEHCFPAVMEIKNVQDDHKEPIKRKD